MKKIIEKLLYTQFKSQLKGYNKEEVDSFLDQIVDELENFQKKYDLLLNEKKILEKNNFDLKMKILNYQEKQKNNAVNSNKYVQNATKHISELDESLKLSRKSYSVDDENTQNISPKNFADDSLKDKDTSLQNRIAQLEQELTNIKKL